MPPHDDKICELSSGQVVAHALYPNEFFVIVGFKSCVAEGGESMRFADVTSCSVHSHLTFPVRASGVVELPKKLITNGDGDVVEC